MPIYLTRLSAEKLRSLVKARGEGDKHNYLSDRAAADKQEAESDLAFLRYRVPKFEGLPVITRTLNSSKFLTFRFGP